MSPISDRVGPGSDRVGPGSDRVSRTVLAGAVADAVRSVPGVARLSPGGVVEVATQFAGGKVLGVLLTPSAVTVHVVVDRVPVPAVAAAAGEAARRALLRLDDQRPVDVVVDDILLDGTKPAVK